MAKTYNSLRVPYLIKITKKIFVSKTKIMNSNIQIVFLHYHLKVINKYKKCPTSDSVYGLILACIFAIFNNCSTILKEILAPKIG